MSDRAWTLLLTGEENGIAGGPGRTFEKHPAHYERVTVIERDPALARIAELERIGEHRQDILEIQEARIAELEALLHRARATTTDAALGRDIDKLLREKS